MVQSLSQIRDAFLPGLHFLQSGLPKRWDLQIDYIMDRLYLVAKDERHLLFTRKDIEGNTYKFEFIPKVLKIIKEVK